LLNKTERLAMIDELTGVYNRRRFTDVLRREWAASRRYQHPLALMLVDVDRFKSVNDSHGHGAGDELLKRVANILSSRVREVDVCARYGGDEFALLLPHTTAEGAVVVAERVREKLRQDRTSWHGEAARVSFSIGVASTEDETLRTPDELIEAADRALYEVKREGRDRVQVARRGVLVR
jgi:diguanylate cyclase (GGDEF)-like protein